MRTHNTTLCLVNLSGKDITKTQVEVDDNDAWDGPSRPDRNLSGPLASSSGATTDAPTGERSRRSAKLELSRARRGGCAR